MGPWEATVRVAKGSLALAEEFAGGRTSGIGRDEVERDGCGVGGDFAGCAEASCDGGLDEPLVAAEGDAVVPGGSFAEGEGEGVGDVVSLLFLVEGTEGHFHALSEELDLSVWLFGEAVSDGAEPQRVIFSGLGKHQGVGHGGSP